MQSTTLPDPDGAGSLTATKTENLYDKRGHLSQITTSDTTGNLTKVFYQHDSAGRLRWESLPLSGGVSASLVRERTYYQHDALGRVTMVETPDAPVAGTTQSWQKTTFTYDDVIRRVSLRQYLTGTASVLSEMWFDPLGRLKATISPSPDNTGIGNPPLIESYTYFDGNTTYGSRGTLVRKVDHRGDVTWMKFGPLGDLLVTEMSDPDGTGPLQTSFQILNYDLMGALISETQSYGTFGSQSGIRTTSYLRNVRGEVTRTMTPDPDGAGALLPLLELREYDNLGRLTTITDAYVSSFDGGGQPVPTKIASTVYAYGTDGLISEERRLDRNDTEDRTISYEYDNYGRTVSMTTPDGTTDYQYDRWGNLSKILGPAIPDSGSPLIRRTTEFVYDTSSAGQFLTEIHTPWSAGTSTGTSKTKLEYDLAGRLVQQFRPVASTGVPSTTATEQWTYDKLNRLTAETDALGNSVTYTWDNLSRPVTIGTAAVSGSNPQPARQEHFKWAANGDLAMYTAPDGRAFSYSYDAWGRVVDEHRLVPDGPDAGTEPDVYETTRTTYDSAHRTASVTRAFGLSSAQTTSFVYDDLDRLRKVVDPTSGEVEYFFDARGFLKQVDNEWNQPRYFEYDDFGRLAKTWEYPVSSTSKTIHTYDSMDRMTSVTDRLGNTTEYEYDVYGQLSRQIDALENETLYAWDRAGNLASLVDPEGNETRWEYDYRGRLQFEKITVGGSVLTREYQYDAADNLTWAKDRNNRWRNFIYQFAYGTSGNYRLEREAWWTSGDGYSNRIMNEYGQGNGLLLTAVTDQNAATSPTVVSSRIEFAYDDLSRITRVRDRIDPTPQYIASESFDISYTLDVLDRRTHAVSRFRQFDSGGVETGFQWDFTNYYTWNSLNRLTTLQQITPVDPASTWATDTEHSKTVQLEYYSHGALKKVTRTEGTSSFASSTLVTDIVLESPEWWYEGRISRIVHSGLDGGTSFNRSLTFEYNDGGQITEEVEKLGSSVIGTRIFGYDDTHQLTEVTDGVDPLEEYAYDANGNRINTGYTTGSFNRVTADGVYTYQYDNEGNRTLRTHQSTGDYDVYTWDFRNRLTSVTTKDSSDDLLQTVLYEYDGLDRRIRRIVKDDSNAVVEQQRFLYDRNVLSSSLLPRYSGGEGARRAVEGAGDFWEVVLVLDELVSGSPYEQVEHRFLNGPQVDQVFSDQNAMGEILWYLQDAQQTVRDVATWDHHDGDSVQEWMVVNHLTYDAFGNLLSADDPTTGTADDGDLPGTDGAYAPQRSYTGREPDAATGLIYYRARWYDPAIGRFISEDPIGFAAGDLNLARYVGNNTPNATDPSGLQEWQIEFSWQTVYGGLSADRHSSAEINSARQQLLLYIAQLEALHNAAERQRRLVNPGRGIERCIADGRIDTLRARSVYWKSVVDRAATELSNARYAEDQLTKELRRARWKEYRERTGGGNPRVDARHAPTDVATDLSLIDQELQDRMRDLVIELATIGAGTAINAGRRGVSLVDNGAGLLDDVVTKCSPRVAPRTGTAGPHTFKPGVTLGPEDGVTINSLRNRMNKKGWQGEPIVVRTLPDGTKEILDGHHRVAAAKRSRKVTEVPWREATPEEAEFYLKHRQQF